MKISIAICDALEREQLNLVQMLQHYGKAHGLEITVDTISSGEELLSLWTPDRWDLIFLDIYMRDLSGVEIARRIRQKDRNCILVFATTSQDHGIIGHELRISDYLVKPFHIRELSARVRALIRRPADLQLSGKLQYGDLTFDKESRKLSSDGKSVQLTARETELFSVLIQSPEKLFNREQLVLKIWGTSSEVEAGNVDNYISFLRKRLRELNSFCKITTVYGAGYKLEKNHAE